MTYVWLCQCCHRLIHDSPVRCLLTGGVHDHPHPLLSLIDKDGIEVAYSYATRTGIQMGDNQCEGCGRASKLQLLRRYKEEG